MKIKLFPKQSEFVFDRTKYSGAFCGKQAGKTFGGAIKTKAILAERTQYWLTHGRALIDRPQALILAYNDDDLKNITFPKFLEVLEEGSYIYHKSVPEVIMKKTGVTIIGRSAFNPLSIESVTVDVVWGDEPGKYQYEAWARIRPRVNTRRGFVIFTGTPEDMGWMYSEFFLKAQNGDKDFAVFNWRTLDNPHADPIAYYKEKEYLSEEEWNRMYNGLFTKLSSLFYDFRIDLHTVEPETIPRYPDRYIMGLDFGQVHPTAFSIVAQCEGHFFLVREKEEKGLQWEDVDSRIKDLKKEFGEMFIVADAEDPRQIDFLREKGHRILTNKRDFTPRIRSVRKCMAEGRFHISKACPRAIKEFSVYARRQDKHGDFLNESTGYGDDLVDSFGYVIQYHTESNIDNLDEKVSNSYIADPLKGVDINQFRTPDKLEEIWGDYSNMPGYMGNIEDINSKYYEP